jgi:prepilin-type N-terminal cleavage/methylation domain-containing protein
VAIRPPKSNYQGFTLIEMIVTIAVAGIIMAIAFPSFLSLNKPLRDASLQFKSHLSLIRSKAISSNKAYRIRPKFSTLAGYPDGVARNFVVEYAANCAVAENSATPAALRWQMASQLDLDLPPNVGITNIATATITSPTTATVTNSLNWNGGKGICFDNRGLLFYDATTRVILQDFQSNNRAKLALIDISKIGNTDINTYSDILASPTYIPLNSQNNPEF